MSENTDIIRQIARQRLEALHRKDEIEDIALFAKKYFGWDLHGCQKGWFEPTKQHKKLLINCSVDVGKSGFFTYIYPVWRICRDRNITIWLTASAYKDISVRAVGKIRDALTIKEIVRDFGEFRTRKDWGVESFTVHRPDKNKRDPTVMAGTPDKSKEGIKPDLIIGDDIIDRRATFSETYRANVWNWYLSTARMRMVPGSQIILVGSVWHPDDIYARLAEKGFHRIMQPAINDDGTPLCPERHSIEYLHEMRDDLTSTEYGTAFFDTRFMVNARAMGGNRLNPEWLQYYDPQLLPRMKRVVQGIDPSSGTKGGDYYARATVGLGEDNKIYLLDMNRRKLDFPARVRDVKAGFDYWHPSLIIIESNMDKGSMYERVKEKYTLPVKSFTETRNKLEKIESMGVYFQNGTVLINKNMYPFIQEYSNFPGAHDDQLDAFILCLDELIPRGAQTISWMEPGRGRHDRQDSNRRGRHGRR